MEPLSDNNEGLQAMNWTTGYPYQTTHLPALEKDQISLMISKCLQEKKTFFKYDTVLT